MYKYTDELEADLRDMGIDLRDYWRPGGGSSQLTTRVLLQIIDLNLDTDTSRFWCAVRDTSPFMRKELMIAQLIELQTGKEYDMKKWFYDRKGAIEDSQKRAEEMLEKEEMRSQVEEFKKQQEELQELMRIEYEQQQAELAATKQQKTDEATTK